MDILFIVCYIYINIIYMARGGWLSHVWPDQISVNLIISSIAWSIMFWLLNAALIIEHTWVVGA